MFVIGIDSGTQGTKALVVDFDSARVLGRGYAAHRMRDSLGPGESEQDPKTWTEAMELALTACLKNAKIKGSGVVALGVSGQQHGFVALDKDGNPIRPAKLWNDTSTVKETTSLLQAMGGRKAYIEKLGIGLAVGFTASKVVWLKNHEPENFRRLAHVLLPHDYLNFYLTGKLQMEHGDASGTGLMDVRRRAWHLQAAAAVDPSLIDKLPPLRHSAEPLGYVKPDLARKFGWDRVLVSSGGGDNMMAAIGTGNVVPGVCTLSLGTSGTIYACSRDPFVDPEGEIAAFCDSTGGWLPLLCTMNVTNTTELFKAMHKLSNEDLEQLAAAAPAGAGGLLFLPFVDGERVPVLPHASAVYFGLSRQNFDTPHMARATIEGTVLNLGYGFARMQTLGLKPTEVRATGGGARSRLWLQIVADVFRTPVKTLEEQEAGAFGAALQAVWCFQRQKDLKASIEDVVKDRVRLGRTTAEPNPENFEIYDWMQTRFNSAWRTLEEEFRRHREQET